MTNEEAIHILKQYREKPTLINEIETVEEAVWFDEALEMAIKALEQELCNDAISRQAVLDLLFNSYIKTELTSIGNASKEYAELCVDELNELPPVNPQPCEDAISRQKVLDVINLNWDYRRNCIRAIEKLPSVNPQEPSDTVSLGVFAQDSDMKPTDEYVTEFMTKLKNGEIKG